MEQTQRSVNATVAWLEQNGWADKRALAVDLPNCPVFVWLLLACARRGQMMVTLNHRLSATDKQLRLAQLHGTAARDCQVIGADEAACLEAAVSSAPQRKSTCCWSTRWQARCT